MGLLVHIADCADRTKLGRLLVPQAGHKHMLASARLVLRRFAAAAVPSFVAYRNDPVIAQYQSWDTYSEQEAFAFIQQQQSLAAPAPGQWWQLAIELQAKGTLIGDCALKVEQDAPRQAEIGFTLARPYQGQGYGTEAVTRLLDYGFMDLRLHRVVAITDCANQAAASLLARLGLRREGHFRQNVWFKGSWGDEYLYAILAAE